MKTVWAADAMPLIPERFRSLYRYLIPGIDLGVIAFGLGALVLGSKIVGDFTIPVFLPIWATMILAGATTSLFALVFLFHVSRLAWIELSARIAVDLGLGIYAWLTIMYIVGGSLTSVLTLVLVAVRIWASLWRVFDIIGGLVREEQRKAATRTVQ